jgi:predicted dehydrogenase
MLTNEELDACVSVMPIERICEIGTLLLQRKLPCVIEKPLGQNLAEIEQLGRVARDTGTPHMVSVNRRFIPYVQQARTWLKDVGPIQYVRATQVRHARSEADFIWSTAIHPLDALRHMVGDIHSVTVETERNKPLSTTWYDVSLTFTSGARGRIEVLPTAGMVEELYELFGEGFRVRLVVGSGTQRSLQCWRNDQLEVDEAAAESEPEHLRNGSYQELEEFISALKAQRPPWPTIEDILPSVRLAFAISEKAASQSRNY